MIVIGHSYHHHHPHHIYIDNTNVGLNTAVGSIKHVITFVLLSFLAYFNELFFITS